MPWNNTTRDYELRDARIVALILGGGAIVERGDFVFREGRDPISFTDEEDPTNPPLLEYICGFRPLDAPEPEASESTEARIVIEGESEGGRLEIRGPGWVGYDDRGFFSGWFDDPPKMILDRLPRVLPDKDERPLSPAEVDALYDSIRPRTSAEYDRATRCREGYGYTDDD